MRAALLRAFGAPLEVCEVADPRPEPGAVVIEVKAVGLCGTDLKITGGVFGDTPLPLIPGHEVSGVVAELGAGVEGFKTGDRVAAHVYDACGECPLCRAGHETLCPNSVRIGFDIDGGLARYLKVKARNLFRFGEGLDFALAGVTMDAVVSTWRALRVRARVDRGERVAVAGAGGLGLSAVQIARAAGAAVAVIDPAEDHRRAALEVGAELAVAPEDARGILEWSRGGVEVGLEASGTRAGLGALVGILRPAARLVVNGYRPGVEYGLDSGSLVLREYAVLGSRNGSREDARQALGAVERGEVRPVIMERLPLAEINRGLDLLRSGAVLGRVVVEP
jgi:D-arabinose 1-dehydrogenase-like Zn-dependent alcohol dehydrogenase